MKYIKRTTKDINKDFLVELLEDRGFKLNNSFFNPTEENELLPINLDNMQLGAEMLKKHIVNNSKIHIIVD